jgi:hypothetical protein
LAGQAAVASQGQGGLGHPEPITPARRAALIDCRPAPGPHASSRCGGLLPSPRMRRATPAISCQRAGLAGVVTILRTRQQLGTLPPKALSSPPIHAASHTSTIPTLAVNPCARCEISTILANKKTLEHLIRGTQVMTTSYAASLHLLCPNISDRGSVWKRARFWAGNIQFASSKTAALPAPK